MSSMLNRIESAIEVNYLPIERRLEIRKSLQRISDPKFARNVMRLIQQVDSSIFVGLCKDGEIEKAEKYRLENEHLQTRYRSAQEWIELSQSKPPSREKDFCRSWFKPREISKLRSRQLKELIKKYINPANIREIQIKLVNDAETSIVTEINIAETKKILVYLKESEINTVFSFICNEYSRDRINLAKMLARFVDIYPPGKELVRNRISKWQKNYKVVFLALRIAKKILKDETTSALIAEYAIKQYQKRFKEKTFSQFKSFLQRFEYLKK